MAPQVQQRPHPDISLAADTPPPAYDTSVTINNNQAIPRTMQRSSLSSETSSLPTYEDEKPGSSPACDPNSFTPTTSLQIETPGKEWLSLPLPLRHDPIPIYAVDPAAPTSQAQNLATPKYISLRQTRRSGNCVLVGGRNSLSSSSSSATPFFASLGAADNVPVLATTLYRFGLGKAPMIRILPLTGSSQVTPAQAFSELDASSKDSSEPKTSYSLNAGADEPPSYEAASNEGNAGEDWTAPMNPVSWHSRASRFETPQGLFEWRYGSRSERKHFDANSVLVLDRIVTSSDKTGSSGINNTNVGASSPRKGRDKDREETRETVGYFIRNKDTRTSGSGRSTAGNGGRLLLDLRHWNSAAPAATPSCSEKDSVVGLLDDKRHLQQQQVVVYDAMETVERAAVTSCLVMLKKEVDRRRLHQALIISGGAGGGP